MVTSQELQQQQSSAQEAIKQQFMQKLRSVKSQEQQRQLRLQSESAMSSIQEDYRPVIAQAKQLELQSEQVKTTTTKDNSAQINEAIAYVKKLAAYDRRDYGAGTTTSSSYRSAGKVFAAAGLGYEEGENYYKALVNNTKVRTDWATAAKNKGGTVSLPQSSLTNITPSATTGMTEESVRLASEKLNAQNTARQEALLKSQDIQGFSGTTLNQQQIAKKNLLENAGVIPRSPTYSEYVRSRTTAGEQYIASQVKPEITPSQYPTKYADLRIVDEPKMNEITQGVLTPKKFREGVSNLFPSMRPIPSIRESISGFSQGLFKSVDYILPSQNTGFSGGVKSNLIQVGRGATIYGLALIPPVGIAMGVNFVESLIKKPKETVTGFAKYASANPFESLTTLGLGIGQARATGIQTYKNKITNLEQRKASFQSIAKASEKREILSRLDEPSLTKYQVGNANLKEIRVFRQDIKVLGEKYPRQFVMIEGSKIGGVALKEGQRLQLGFQLMRSPSGKVRQIGTTYSRVVETGSNIGKDMNQFTKLIVDTTYNSKVGREAVLARGGGKVKQYESFTTETIKSKGSAAGFNTGGITKIYVNGKLVNKIPQKSILYTDVGRAVTTPLKEVKLSARQSGFAVAKAEVLRIGGRATKAVSNRMVAIKELRFRFGRKGNVGKSGVKIKAVEVGDIRIDSGVPAIPIKIDKTPSKPYFTFENTGTGEALLQDTRGGTTLVKSGSKVIQKVKSVSIKSNIKAPASATVQQVATRSVQSTIQPQLEFSQGAVLSLTAIKTQQKPAQIERTTQTLQNTQALQLQQRSPQIETPQIKQQQPSLEQVPTFKFNITTQQLQQSTQQQQQQISQTQLQLSKPRTTSKGFGTSGGGAASITPPTVETPTRMLGLARKAMGTEAFKVQIMKGGKFKTIAEGLPKGRALKLGADVTGTTLASQFRIVKSGQTTMGDIEFKPNPKVFRDYRVSKGKSIPLPRGEDVFQFIEKTRKRLKSEGELSEINVFKIRGIQRVKQTRLFGSRRKRK